MLLEVFWWPWGLRVDLIGMRLSGRSRVKLGRSAAMLPAASNGISSYGGGLLQLFVAELLPTLAEKMSGLFFATQSPLHG